MANGTTTLTKVNVAARETVERLDTRLGRRRVRWIGGAVVVIVGLLLLRTITAPKKQPAAPPARPVAVMKAITKDVPLYMDESCNCATTETFTIQAQVSGQIASREFEGGATVKQGQVLFTIADRQ